MEVSSKFYLQGVPKNTPPCCWNRLKHGGVNFETLCRNLLNRVLKLQLIVTNRYEDDRVARPWDNMKPWAALKPTMPWGQVPCLTYNGQKICQSMTICRFLAREIGIAGRNSLEMAQVDEIIDVISDGIDATVSI